MLRISTPAYIAVLAGCVVLYWCLPRWREHFLALMSAALLATMDWKSVAWVTGFAGLAFVSTNQLARFKWLKVVACLSVGGYLAFHKYLPPLLEYAGGKTTPVLVPLGASYFTFKLIHYVIEQHRGHLPPHKLSEFLAYIFFIPMFTAGPIERFDDYLKHRTAKFSLSIVYEGGTRIVYGLIKKFVILDLILSRHEMHSKLIESIPLIYPSYPTDKLLENLSTLNPLYVWQYVINGFVGGYVDFSGYCDIAIGLGILFGVKLTENFDYPFFVSNIGDFWKRYHMSLSNWAQRYVYFPVLGATRNAQLALFSTMLMIGVWHAGNLNYLLWGFYQASMLSIHLVWARYRRRRLGREEEDSTFAKIVESRPFAFAGGILTFLGVCGSYALPSTQTQGIRAGARVLLGLVGVHV